MSLSTIGNDVSADGKLTDWNLYRVFLTVAREGKLAGAAARLEASISTVHRQLAELEAALDTRLFERRGRGRVLTAAGESLAERLTRVEEQLVSVTRQVAGQDELARGTVHVTTTDSVAHALLPRYLPILRERLPAVHLHVTVDNRHYRLGRGEADVALRPRGAVARSTSSRARSGRWRWRTTPRATISRAGGGPVASGTCSPTTP